MENNAELMRLEQFVDTLLKKYNDLKGRFHALEVTLRERDDECASLKGDIVRLQSERSDVGSRVSSLLGRIEEWEAQQVEPDSAGESDGKQGSLFESGNQEYS